MTRLGLSALALLAIAVVPQRALAVSSAEFYTQASYGYGRFEASVKFAGGEGVIGSFFLWKSGSDQAGTFWNELDFEKVGADCHLESNPLYGNPAVVHAQRNPLSLDLCGGYHTYAYEWTADHIAWLVDGMEVRRETGDAAAAYATNASAAGMQIHFNIWPGDASFGGNFSAAILPVHEYIDWVQYSAYANGAFTKTWREDFDGATAPTGWLTGNWSSPKNLSKDVAQNVNFLNGVAVLSLTTDDALGPAGAMPGNPGGSAGTSGLGGSAGGTSLGGSGGTAAGGSTASGGSAGTTSSGGSAGGSAFGGNAASAGGNTASAGGNTASAGGNAASAGGNTASAGSSPVSAGSSALSASGAGGAATSGGPIGAAGSTTGPSSAGMAGSPNGAASTAKSGGCSLVSSPEPSQGLAWFGVVATAVFFRSRRARRTASLP